LELAGRTDVAVAAGAEVSMTTLAMPGGIGDDDAYWGGFVPHRPSPAGAAFDLMEASVRAGATIVAIGPYTNLGLLEVTRPGLLATAPVVLMGSVVQPPAEGLPPWGPDFDWNVQCDTRAAEIVLGAAEDLTVVTLSATAAVHLRAAHLPRLEAAGPLGNLVARQARAHADDNHMDRYAERYPGLPTDLVNYQHDPLACAVAAGWGAVTDRQVSLHPEYEGDVLRFATEGQGRPARVVVGADDAPFAAKWLDCIRAAARGPVGDS
ncbi:MAG TPA: nucleoside hydrolase, partial [Acidimicrobiales bacterium]|nr:nucleoside hydrolase [Acidimicrobiales bacterium]